MVIPVDHVINFTLDIHDKNSSGDEIANVNFYAVRPEATKFTEITRNNGHYAVQGHSRSPIFIPIESSCATTYY